jgi:acyl carrier protein
MADSELCATLRTYLTSEIINDPDYPLGDDEPIISSGLVDSFSLVDVALWIEEQYDVHIDNTELNADNFDTVAELADYIENNR